jgi:F-type H+-transporting ATPase subunit delta
MSSLATIARPYAQALFQAVGNEPDMAVWLEVVAEMAKEPVFQVWVRSPGRTIGQVLHILDALWKKELSPVSLRFLEQLHRYSRWDAMSQIADQFVQLQVAQRGLVTAKIYSAFPLTEAQKEELRPGLEKRFARSLCCQWELDETLMAGFRVQVGDEVWDLSVKEGLASMKSHLLAV